MWWLYIILVLYILGGLGTFFIEATAGPVTLGLAALRGASWPIYITTGIPKGQRARPGDQYD